MNYLKITLINTLIITSILVSCSKEENNPHNTQNQKIETFATERELIETKDIEEGDTNLNSDVENTPSPSVYDIVQMQLNEMTLEEKVGQMFIVTPEVFSNSGVVTDISNLDIDDIKKYNVGGFIFFANNIVNPQQITKLNNDLYNIFDEQKLFLAVDEEGGQVARISNNINFPDKRIENMNTVTDTNRAYEIGVTIGSYLANYGFNTNFAPVADVLVNDKNTVVKQRSFSSNPNVVEEMSFNLYKGLKENNIFASAKHFPGHGSTELDTHHGFALSYSTLEQLNNIELLPFKKLIDENIEMIMISHVIYPNISSNNLPASLNYDIIQSLLIDELNYEGLVITDGMNMGAIVNNFSVEDSTTLAILAGVDIILIPNDFHLAYNTILEAVNNGEITEERIDFSVKKILKLKLQIQ